MYHLPNVKGFRTVLLDTKAAPHSPVSGSLSQHFTDRSVGPCKCAAISTIILQGTVFYVSNNIKLKTFCKRAAYYPLI